jgi:hypothetical protein
MWHVWERGKMQEDFGRTPEGKTPLTKPRHRGGTNIKMDLLEIRAGGGHALDCSDLG